MTAAVILAVSLIALLQFFMSYCRSVVAAYGGLPLSEQVRDLVGIHGRNLGGEEFEHLLQLASLCPDDGVDGREIMAVRTYFRMLRAFHAASRQLFPSLASVLERELSACSRFAAVALDRRITFSRGLMAQQLSS